MPKPATVFRSAEQNALEEGWFYEGAGIYRDAWLVKTAAVSVAPFG